ncbi:MAG TPA: maleylpyruvate isomerase family mycothiol-dependent enzyme [Streptosporangiaceae bacterium]|nr:maleylpyruvate isomerase family mycothiol-dependent enzyme [Streptosporangiaceae bacterium]
MPISAERWYAEIETSTKTLAGLVQGADLTRPVPTCPDWTLRQLATHVGRAHRWAAQIASTRSAEFIPFREVPDGRFPDDPAQHAPWLRTGAGRVIGAVRAAGSDPVWAFTGLRPASFWARRMAHETAVHRADAEIAAGREPGFEPDLAADAIDEWLSFLSGPLGGDPDPRLDVLPEGAVLHVHATDDGLDGAGEWLVRREGSQVTVQPGHAKGDVVVRGPAGRLLLVLLRRLPADDPQVQVLGDPALLAGWLAATPF